jgi:hypothetical protein
MLMLAVLVVGGLFSGPPKLPTTISSPPGAPVAISYCTAWTYPLDDGPQSHIAVGADFTNVTDKPIASVRFKFALETKFKEPIGNLYTDDDGTFSPQAVIQRSNHSGRPWNFLNVWGNVGAATCSLDAVRFADGSVWKASSD